MAIPVIRCCDLLGRFRCRSAADDPGAAYRALPTLQCCNPFQLCKNGRMSICETVPVSASGKKRYPTIEMSGIVGLTARACPERVDEDQKEIAAANPVGQALLAGWSVARKLQYLAERSRSSDRRSYDCWSYATAAPHVGRANPFRCGANGAIACVRCEADNLVAGEDDKLRLRMKAPNDRIHRGERLLVRRTGNPEHESP